jgi:hypothetical protein
MSHSRDTNIFKILRTLYESKELTAREMFDASGINAEFKTFNVQISEHVNRYKNIMVAGKKPCGECGTPYRIYALTPKGRELFRWIDSRPL